MAPACLKAQRLGKHCLGQRKKALGRPAMALSSLGVYYENGYGGLAKDNNRAFEIYTKAAGHGVDIDMRNLAECFRDGRGTPKSMPKAIEWLEKAVAAGSKIAAFDLGENLRRRLGQRQHELGAICQVLSRGFEIGWAGLREPN